MIEVFVNGEIRSFTHPLSVSALIEALQLNPKAGMALAVNEEVLPRSLWKERLLKPFDKVIIIKATAGG